MDGGERAEVVPEQILEIKGVLVGHSLHVGNRSRRRWDVDRWHKGAEDKVAHGFDSRDERRRWLGTNRGRKSQGCELPDQTGFG